MDLFLSKLTKHLRTIFFILLVYVIYKWWIHPHKCFPKGVRGFPIVGAIPYLGKYPERVIAKWSRSTYGPVMSVRMRMTDVVLINDYDTLQNTFLKQRLVYGGRPSFPILKCKYMQGGGLTFRATDKEEQIQRKFALKSFRRSNEDADHTEDKIKLGLHSLIQRIKKTNENAADIKFLVATSIANNISCAAFGKMFDMDSKDLRRMILSLFGEYGKKSSEYVGVLILYPGLKPFPPFTSAFEDFVENAANVTNFVQKEIKRRKEEKSDERSENFLDQFVAEQKFRKGMDGFYDGQLLVAIAEFFTAGIDTSTCTIMWGITCAINHPKCQRKIQEEIDSEIGSDAFPSLEHRARLPYTMAFIQEVFRFRTVVPFGIKRMTMKDTTLGGFHISKNTTIMPNIWAIHNDPKVWKNPESFNPERHLDADGSFIPSRKVIPFGIGARSCIGEKLARMQIFLIFSSLFQSFSFLPEDSNKLPELNSGINTLLFSPFAFNCIAKIRH